MLLAFSLVCIVSFILFIFFPALSLLIFSFFFFTLHNVTLGIPCIGDEMTRVIWESIKNKVLITINGMYLHLCCNCK